MKISIKLSIDTLIRKLSHTQGNMGKEDVKMERDGNYAAPGNRTLGITKSWRIRKVFFIDSRGTILNNSTFSIQNTKQANFCYFKPSSLHCMLTSSLRKQYTRYHNHALPSPWYFSTRMTLSCIFYLLSKYLLWLPERLLAARIDVPLFCPIFILSRE